MAWFTNDRDKDGFVGVENHNENRKINPFKCEKKHNRNYPWVIIEENLSCFTMGKTGEKHGVKKKSTCLVDFSVEPTTSPV